VDEKISREMKDRIKPALDCAHNTTGRRQIDLQGDP
jgi:hypothetical protein